jgi:hypothetical protein
MQIVTCDKKQKEQENKHAHVHGARHSQRHRPEFIRGVRKLIRKLSKTQGGKIEYVSKKFAGGIFFLGGMFFSG